VKNGGGIKIVYFFFVIWVSVDAFLFFLTLYYFIFKDFGEILAGNYEPDVLVGKTDFSFSNTH
jgi:hypothetical protein